jgi:diguanylate cyclase (GGDEF)-like protein
MTIAPEGPLGSGSVQALLDALPGAAAVLDRHGSVVAANAGWAGVTSVADILGELTGVAGAITEVLQARSARAEVEHAAGSGDQRRWYRTVVTPVEGGGALTLRLDITADRARAERLAHVASHDDLTGLPSRSLFDERLQEALEDLASGAPGVGVLFVDVDDFKVVNDTLGHLVGDTVIRTIASRIAGALRHGDVPGRYGGDEFVVLLPRAASPEEVREVGTRLHASACEPIDLGDGRSTQVSVSVGGAFTDCPAGPDDVVVVADAAMYRAKHAGKGRVSVSRCPSARGQPPDTR